MFILTLFCLFKDFQCVNWRSSAQLGEAILSCLMTKQVQQQCTLHCALREISDSVSVSFLYPHFFYKQTLLAMTGSKISHSHHGNACSLSASVFLELWDLATDFTHCHLENFCLQDQMYSRCRTVHPFMTSLLCRKAVSSFSPLFFSSCGIHSHINGEDLLRAIETRKHSRNTFRIARGRLIVQ